MNNIGEKRGTVQHDKRIRQLVRFSGIKYGSITPTDIDMSLDYHKKLFVFCEFKLKGTEVLDGQKMHLEALVDGLGQNAIAFICEHDIEDASQDVIAADAIVKSYYYCGEWTKAKNAKTVKWCIDWFLSAKTKQEG